MAATRITTQDIKDATITDADVATANKDGAVGTASMRTIGTPAVVLGTAAAVGSGQTALGTGATIVAFDVTVPSTQAFGDAAATGSAAVAARRDHKHAMPADPGTVPTFVTGEVPSGTVDGSNADFTLASTPTAGSLAVYKNGIRQKVGAGNDYTLATATITFEAGNIPGTGDNLLADYRH